MTISKVSCFLCDKVECKYSNTHLEFVSEPECGHSILLLSIPCSLFILSTHMIFQEISLPSFDMSFFIFPEQVLLHRHCYLHPIESRRQSMLTEISLEGQPPHAEAPRDGCPELWTAQDLARFKRNHRNFLCQVPSDNPKAR